MGLNRANLSLSDLSIPSELPTHGSVVRVPSAKPPSAPKAGVAARQWSAGTRASAASHISRVRDLRAASQPATPSLSPLALTSPKISKKPSRQAAGLGSRSLLSLVQQQQQQQQQKLSQLSQLSAMAFPPPPMRHIATGMPSRRVPLAAPTRKMAASHRPSRIPQARHRPGADRSLYTACVR